MENDELAKALAALDSTLKEILKWVRFTSLLHLKKVLIETLVEDKGKLVYEMTDGDRSTTDVSRLSGVPPRTVARRWQSWAKIGIVEKTEKYGGSRVRHVCSLEDVGIAVPKAKIAGEEGGEEKKETEGPEEAGRFESQ